MRRMEIMEAQRIIDLLKRRGLSVDGDFQDRAHLAIRMMHGQIISSMLHGPGPFTTEDPMFHRELGIMLLRYLGLHDEKPARR
jgi:hypothetical protein